MSSEVKLVTNKQQALLRLKEHVPVTSVVDVGVREGTAELRIVFSDLHHLLIDPMNADFRHQINEKYEGVSFSMLDVAVSDENTSMWLVKQALLGDGKTTHSYLRTEPEHVDGRVVTSCQPMRCRRLDDLLLELDIDQNFLLKIDVDGIEERVIDGASAVIERASTVVCECTYSSLQSRLALLNAKGFSLVDLVDRVYYGDAIYQLDAILVRKDLLDGSHYRPPIAQFEPSLWRPLD